MEIEVRNARASMENKRGAELQRARGVCRNRKLSYNLLVARHLRACIVRFMQGCWMPNSMRADESRPLLEDLVPRIEHGYISPDLEAEASMKFKQYEDLVKHGLGLGHANIDSFVQYRVIKNVLSMREEGFRCAERAAGIGDHQRSGRSWIWCSARSCV